jgi:TPR repeat protein
LAKVQPALAKAQPALAKAQPALAQAQNMGDSPKLDPQEIAMLVSRGEDYLTNGDLASARLLLRRAAAAGSANAALALGATFDPLVIRRLGAIGAESDIERARTWYQKAVELGSTAASRQLATLAQLPQ